MVFDRQRYVELKTLGQGGFSTVYLCKDLFENRTVALKVIKTGKLNKKNLTRLQDEFFLLNSLKHRNLVKVFDIGYNRETNTIFYTMEYCEKVNIIKFLINKDEETIVKALVQILRALHYIHSHDIVHFDIKPENFGIIEDNVDFTVKLMDFGLFLPVSQITKSSMRGTIFYMAPELFSKEMEKDHRVDLYSLGMVFLKLLMIRNNISLNQKYFDIETLTEEQKNRIKEKRLFGIISKLVQKKVAKRFASAVEVLDEINKVYRHYFTILPPRGKEELFFEPRFVGRNNELNFLKAFLVSLDVEKHKKPFILIKGESGIGKTRLMNEFRLHAQLQGFRVRRAYAVSSDRIFDVAIQLFKKMMPVYRKEVFAGMDKDIVSLLQHTIYSESPVFSPVIFESMDGEILSKFLYSFVEIFKRLVEQSKETHIYFIEDLQNIDEFSLHFLRAFLSKKINVLWVMNYRSDIKLPDYVSGFLDEIENADLSQSIELKALTESDVDELIRSSFPKAFLGYKFVHFVYDKTAGNPLLITELFKTLIAKEYLYIEKGIWKFKEDAEIEFGEKVESILRYRIESLPNEAVKVVKVMSLIDEPVSEKFLEAVVGGNTVYDAIGILIEKRIITEFSRKFMFAHSRIKDTVYSMVKDAELAELYFKIASTNEELSEFSFEKTANWYLKSGNREKAEEYYKLAFENYMGTYKNEKVIEIGNVLLELTKDIEEKKFYLKSIIRMLFFLGKARESEKYIAELEAILLTERDELDMCFYKAEYYVKTGHVSDALNILYSLVSEDNVKNFPVRFLPELYLKIGSLLLKEGNLTEAELFFSLAGNTLKGKEDERYYGTLQQFFGLLDFLNGKFEEAFRKWQKAEEIFKKTSFLPGLAAVYLNYSRGYAVYCNWEKAEVFLKKAIEILSNIGNLSQLAECYILSAKIERLRGDFLMAEKHLEEVENLLNAVEDRSAKIMFNLEKAIFHMETGEWFNAENQLIIAGTLANTSDFQKDQVLITFYNALLNYYKGNFKESYADLLKARQSFESAGSFIEKTLAEMLKIALDVETQNFLDAESSLDSLSGTIVETDLVLLKVYYYLNYGILLAKTDKKEESYRKLHLALALTRKHGLTLLSLVVLSAIYRELLTFLSDETKELIIAEIKMVKKEFIAKFPKAYSDSVFNRRCLSAIKFL